jgi:hypothetical protein
MVRYYSLKVLTRFIFCVCLTNCFVACGLSSIDKSDSETHSVLGNGSFDDRIAKSLNVNKVVVVFYIQPDCESCVYQGRVLSRLSLIDIGSSLIIVSKQPFGSSINSYLDKAGLVLNDRIQYLSDEALLVKTRFSIYSTPTILVISHEGSIVSRIDGEAKLSYVESKINEAIKAQEK